MGILHRSRLQRRGVCEMGRKLLSATLLILMAVSLGANIAYAALSVSTNKFTYNIGESVTITVSGASATSRLMVQINNPSGKPVDLWETTVSTVGSYSFSWKTSDSLSWVVYNTHKGPSDRSVSYNNVLSD